MGLMLPRSVARKSVSELPAGCRIYVGHPKTANPFIQLYLPAGFRCGRKKSRAVSFNPEGRRKEP